MPIAKRQHTGCHPHPCRDSRSRRTIATSLGPTSSRSQPAPCCRLLPTRKKLQLKTISSPPGVRP